MITPVSAFRRPDEDIKIYRTKEKPEPPAAPVESV